MGMILWLAGSLLKSGNIGCICEFVRVGSSSNLEREILIVLFGEDLVLCSFSLTF
jgi:hypothetical protein